MVVLEIVTIFTFFYFGLLNERVNVLIEVDLKPLYCQYVFTIIDLIKGLLVCSSLLTLYRIYTVGILNVELNSGHKVTNTDFFK